MIRVVEERDRFSSLLNAKLAEINDLEKIKKTITPANTPERTEALARIMRVRRAKEILSKAAQKAYKEGLAVLQKINSVKNIIKFDEEVKAKTLEIAKNLKSKEILK